MPSYLDAYDWRARINGSTVSGHTYRILLPADVYDGCRSFPLDIKVVDAAGLEFPGLIVERSAKGHIDPVRFSSRTAAENNAATEFEQREFAVESDALGQPNPTHNRVTVNVAGDDVVRRVEVWGGDSADTLELLGSDTIVEQKEPFPVRSRAVNYPESSASVVQVRIFPDQRQTNAALSWRATDIMRVVVDEEDHERMKMDRMDAPDGEAPPEGVFAAYLDTGAQNRQLLYLDLDTSASEFMIPVAVYGRNDTTSSWRWVTESGIHDIAGRKETRVPLPRSDFRYLKVEFRHGGKKSPRFSDFTAGAAPHYLVFTALSDQKAYIYFGSSRYKLPTTELARGIGRRTIAEAEELTLSSRHVNPTRVASTLNKYGKTLLNLGVGIVALLVAIFTIRMIWRRFQPAG